MTLIIAKFAVAALLGAGFGCISVTENASDNPLFTLWLCVIAFTICDVIYQAFAFALSAASMPDITMQQGVFAVLVGTYIFSGCCKIALMCWND